MIAVGLIKEEEEISSERHKKRRAHFIGAAAGGIELKFVSMILLLPDDGVRACISHDDL